MELSIDSYRCTRPTHNYRFGPKHQPWPRLHNRIQFPCCNWLPRHEHREDTPRIQKSNPKNMSWPILPGPPVPLQPKPHRRKSPKTWLSHLQPPPRKPHLLSTSPIEA